MAFLASRLLVALLLAALAAPALAGPSPGDALRDKLYATYAKISSYKITVLGAVRSSGVYVAPDKYAVSTVFEGKRIKTIFAGASYWIYSNGKWEKSESSAENLRFDAAALLRAVRSVHGTLEKLSDASMNGHKVGVFAFTFKNDGTREVCNYEMATYRIVRCKTDQLTVLYSGFNEASNKITVPK